MNHNNIWAIRGLPQGGEATIRTLADRVVLRRHSAVELIDRLERHGYVCRSGRRDDRRLVMVSLLPRGLRVLEDQTTVVYDVSNG